MGVGRPDCVLLQAFGAFAEHAFGHTAYHVGSSLTEKRGWRDVDVRLIMPDEDWIAEFGDFNFAGWNSRKLHAQEMAWSYFGRGFTKLPIDFQIQAMSIANQDDGPRSALRNITHEARALANQNPSNETGK